MKNIKIEYKSYLFSYFSLLQINESCIFFSFLLHFIPIISSILLQIENKSILKYLKINFIFVFRKKKWRKKIKKINYRENFYRIFLWLRFKLIFCFFFSSDLWDVVASFLMRKVLFLGVRKLPRNEKFSFDGLDFFSGNIFTLGYKTINSFFIVINVRPKFINFAMKFIFRS